jgi:hypothetical protein
MRKQILFIIAFFIILAFTFYQHELVHTTILNYDGCEDTKIGFKYTYFYATCLESNYYPSEWSLLAHSINEIVSYTIISTILLLFLLNRLMKDRSEED